MEDALDIKHKVILLHELLRDLLDTKLRSKQFIGKYFIAPQYYYGKMYLTIWNNTGTEVHLMIRTCTELYYPGDELAQEFFAYYLTTIEYE